MRESKFDLIKIRNGVNELNKVGTLAEIEIFGSISFFGIERSFFLFFFPFLFLFLSFTFFHEINILLLGIEN
jgi:hypothetical protein